MALKDIKARIQSQMKAIDSVSNVYTYRRNLSAEADQALLIGADGRMHFWFIYREMTALTDLVVNEKLTQQDDTRVIEGYYGVKDSDDSEEAFDLIVDSVLQAINNDRRPVPGGTKLNGFVQSAEAPALRKMDLHMYGPSQVLCHHVEIVMKVTPRYLQ